MPTDPAAPHQRPAAPPRRGGRRRAAVVLVALGLLAVACGADDRGDEVRGEATRVPSTAEDAEVAADVSRRLAGPLLAALAASEGANLAVSPWLAVTSLAELRTGTAGDTRAALDAALGTAGVDDDELLRSVGALHDALEARSGEQRSAVRKGTVELLPAAALWVQRGTTIDDGWLDQLAAGTGTGLRTVDFRSDPEGARQAVNRWAADATDDQIRQLVPRGAVTADTRLMAAESLWLRAPWAVPFPVERTAPAPFTLADGTSAEVPTMQLVPAPRLRWAEDEGVQVVELAYLGDELRVLVLVPRTGGAEELAATLTGERLDGLLDDLRAEPVSVALPRFAFTSDLDLTVAYEALGVGQLLVPDDADLSALAPGEGLAVSEAVQQVFTSVDEEGTQTSAATVAREPVADEPDAVRIEATRPFVFLVVDGATRAVVLAGAVRDPRA